eukprot:CAMPEP_0172177666 /NCGR_PEP_ID=MMETSP1050-20130122/15578_1 /TAXON_ID=233186 /ORGANISM="Cryptomonas curvata, Strain CCAP979/52" /LENGTH=256 /DNA_ID=CAMNT_0012850241 /DNA_START=6 /DNA_END=776 /DNA_ORIENTATION=+
MALPFDPSKGELKDTIPVDLDCSKMLPLEKWNPDCTPVVLLASGSYSPPTIMHTRIFETARDFLHIDQSERKIQIVGGFMSPVHELYGKKSLYDSAFTPHRVELVKLAVESSDWIQCDEWEVKQKEWTRTKIVMDRFTTELNKKFEGKKVRVMFLCGADILGSMSTPGIFIPEDIRVILEYGIVCIKRKDSSAEDIIRGDAVLSEFSHNIHLATEWDNDVSSSNVRESLSKGKSIKYWVDDRVNAYIAEHRLYARA